MTQSFSDDHSLAEWVDSGSLIGVACGADLDMCFGGFRFGDCFEVLFLKADFWNIAKHF